MSKKIADNTFVHHVLFFLKNPDSKADQIKFFEGIDLLSSISTIRQFHVGVPATTNREVIVQNYTYSWLCFFDSAEDEAIYQSDPIHDEFRDHYGHLWEKVVIYDSTTSTPVIQ
jgi:hypothetical protein